MKQLVQELVHVCVTCQRYKSKNLQPAGLLLPLPVPQGVWTDIALDFVEALPRVRGKTVILMVVDRFSKYCHFIPLAHPYTAESVVEAFFTDIVCLHGIPQTMVSDRDPVFTSTFWRELMRLTGTKLQMTTTFHPQSCTCGVSQVTVRSSGSDGFRGWSSSSTPPTSLLARHSVSGGLWPGSSIHPVI
jgi:hypothetical protein